MIDELENGIYIHLTKIEYEYLKDMCNSMYGALGKLPKKMRTEKFSVLENMITNIFTK